MYNPSHLLSSSLGVLERATACPVLGSGYLFYWMREGIKETMEECDKWGV
jgi:hypothetical protein